MVLSQLLMKKNPPSALMKVGDFDHIDLHSFGSTFIVAKRLSNVLDIYIFRNLRQTHKKTNSKHYFYGIIFCLDCSTKDFPLSYHINLNNLGASKTDFESTCQLVVSNNLLTYGIIQSNQIKLYCISNSIPFKDVLHDIELNYLENEPINTNQIEIDDDDDEKYIPYSNYLSIQNYVELSIQYTNLSTIKTYEISNVIQLDLDKLIAIKQINNTKQIVMIEKNVIEETNTYLYLDSNVDITKSMIILHFNKQLEQLMKLNDISINFEVKLTSALINGQKDIAIEYLKTATYEELLKSLQIANTFININDSVDYVGKSLIDIGLYIIKQLLKLNTNIIYDNTYQQFSHTIINLMYPLRNQQIKQINEQYDKSSIIIIEKGKDIMEQGKQEIVNFLYGSKGNEAIHKALEYGFKNIKELFEEIKNTTCNSKVLKGCLFALKTCKIENDYNLFLLDEQIPSKHTFGELGINVIESLEKGITRYNELLLSKENGQKEKHRNIEKKKLEIQTITWQKETLENSIKNEQTKLNNIDQLTPSDIKKLDIQNKQNNINDMIHDVKEKEQMIQLLKSQYDDLCLQKDEEFHPINLIIPSIEIPSIQLPNSHELICPLSISTSYDINSIYMELNIIDKSNEFIQNHHPKLIKTFKSLDHFFTPTTNIIYLPFYYQMLDSINPCNEWMMGLSEINNIDFPFNDSIKYSPSKEGDYTLENLYSIQYTYSPQQPYNISTKIIQPLNKVAFPFKECLEKGDVIFPLQVLLETYSINEISEIVQTLSHSTSTIILTEILTQKHIYREKQFTQQQTYPQKRNLSSIEFEVYGYYNKNNLPKEFYDSLHLQPIHEILYFFDQHSISIPFIDTSNEFCHLMSITNYSKTYPSIQSLFEKETLIDSLKSFGELGDFISSKQLSKCLSLLVCEFLRCIEYGAFVTAHNKLKELNDLIKQNKIVLKQILDIFHEYFLDCPITRIRNLIEIIENNNDLIIYTTLFNTISYLIPNYPKHELTTFQNMLTILVHTKHPLLEKFLSLCSIDERFIAIITHAINTISTSTAILHPSNIIKEIYQSKSIKPQITRVDLTLVDTWKEYLSIVNTFESKDYILNHHKKCCQYLLQHTESCAEQLCSIVFIIKTEIAKITNDENDIIEAEKYNQKGFLNSTIVFKQHEIKLIKKALRLATDSQMLGDVFTRSTTRLKRITINTKKIKDLTQEIVAKSDNSNDEFSNTIKQINHLSHTVYRLQLIRDIVINFPLRRDHLDMFLNNYHEAIIKMFNHFCRKEFLVLLVSMEKWEALFESLRALKHVEMINDTDVIDVVMNVLFEATEKLQPICMRGWTNKLVGEIVEMFTNIQLVIDIVLKKVETVDNLHVIAELLGLTFFATEKCRDKDATLKVIQICYKHLLNFTSKSAPDIIRFLSKTETFNDMLIDGIDVYTYLFRKALTNELSYKDIIPNNDSKLNPTNVFFLSNSLTNVIKEMPLSLQLDNERFIVDCYIYINQIEDAAHFQYNLGKQLMNKFITNLDEQMMFPHNSTELLQSALSSYAGAMSLFFASFNSVWMKKCSDEIMGISLQLMYDNVQIIGLDHFSAQELLCYFTSFEDANIFATIYNFDETSKWSTALMQQCVIMNNINYLKEWAKCYVMDQKTYSKIIEHMKCDTKTIHKKNWDVFIHQIYAIWPHLIKENKLNVANLIRKSHLKLYLGIEIDFDDSFNI
ncbi:Spatacsin C-terminal domain-containing protein [Entamoeba marina]